MPKRPKIKKPKKPKKPKSKKRARPKSKGQRRQRSNKQERRDRRRKDKQKEKKEQDDEEQQQDDEQDDEQENEQEDEQGHEQLVLQAAQALQGSGEAEGDEKSRLLQGSAAYDRRARTLEVQVFPHNLRASWDDTGCCLLMLLLLSAAVICLPASCVAYHWLLAGLIGRRLSRTAVELAATWLLTVAIASGCVLCSCCCLCACGVSTQLRAARKQQFGSLRKNRLLLRLMRGRGAWEDENFQRRLRRERRRLKRVEETAADRLDAWLHRRDVRVQFMSAQRYNLARMRTEIDAEEDRAECTVM